MRDASRPSERVKRRKPPRSVSSDVDELLQPRRRRSRQPSAPVDTRLREGNNAYDGRRPRDRRVQYTRARRRDLAGLDDVDLEKHAWYDSEADHHWRVPLGKPLRRHNLVLEDLELAAEQEVNSKSSSPSTLPPWTDPKTVRPNGFPLDRTDRRKMHRDRSGKRIGNAGARWRGLMARKDLVDGKADAYLFDNLDKSQDLSPRSSFDIEEATSYTSWDDPPSTSVRGWRSNNSLSYRPLPQMKPRNIRDIGRQRCINDLTNIVDAANEACVSYDRQIFDPVSKLWTYVGKSQPSSSPWELRAVGSPVTCSVSGTEEGVSMTCRTNVVASRIIPIDVTARARRVDVVAPPPAPPPNAHAPPTQDSKRRNTSPVFAAVTSTREAKRAFKATRDFWLGGARKSVYGPANLDALVIAAELDEEEGLQRRASMT